MKKISIIVLALMLALMSITLVSCDEYNYQMVDTTYGYDRAIISLPNGDVVEGEVDSWLDFEDGDQIQVKINGTTYLVHISDVVLIKDKK